MVVMDDSLTGIIAGIKEGRILFANLRCSMAYTFAHILPEVWIHLMRKLFEVCPIIMTSIFGIPLGLSTLQVCSCLKLQ